jgi:hypothetical protein
MGVQRPRAAALDVWLGLAKLGSSDTENDIVAGPYLKKALLLINGFHLK